MNSKEIFLDNKKAIENVYNGFFEFLKNLRKVKTNEISAKCPSIFAGPSEIQPLGALRFGSPKASSLVAIGFSSDEAKTVWSKIFPQETHNLAGKTTSYEFEILKHLCTLLDPQMKACGFTVDLKSAILQEVSQLGDWAKINVDSMLRLPIATDAGELCFDIPLFDSRYLKARTQQIYGFKDSSRILVAEDSLPGRKASRNSLAMAGYFNVDEVADGETAFSKIAGTRPGYDLVIVDRHTPKLSGLDLLKKIRSIPEFKSLPFIMLTGEEKREDILHTLRQGATGYLVRPLSQDAFYNSLKKAGGRS